MSQWVAFGKLRAQFHLYVPASAIDSTRRLCVDLGIPVAEIWAYHSIGDQLRFTLVQKTGPGLPKGSPEPRSSAPKATAVNGAGRSNDKAAAAKPVAKPAVPKKAAKASAPPPPPVIKKVVAAKKAAPAKAVAAVPKKAAKPAAPAKAPAPAAKKKAAPPAKPVKRR
jgi:hypothetical protein